MLKENVKQYANTLNELDVLKQDLKIKQDEFELSVEKIKNKISEKQSQISSLKENIETEAVNEFKETGSKKLYGGIGVQERISLAYDEDKAFSFAKEKSMFLKFDKKAFDKVATSLDLDWVTETKDPKVTFPSKIKIED